ENPFRHGLVSSSSVQIAPTHVTVSLFASSMITPVLLSNPRASAERPAVRSKPSGSADSRGLRQRHPCPRMGRLTAEWTERKSSSCLHGLLGEPRDASTRHDLRHRPRAFSEPRT